MKSYKDFNLPPVDRPFIGDKIKIPKILGRQITVLDFKIEDSTAFPGTKRIKMQIEFGGEKRFVLCKGVVLQEDLTRIKERKGLPFTTTIISENDTYLFS